MFEVIYISTSCRQAVNFIDELTIKLKQRGICGFNIDHKNIQLKSDKFIVSAVDVFGANIGRSYRFTKYYIDKAEPTNFEMWKIVEKINNAVKDIKTRFPRNVKEISEEKLIEILTEVSTHD